MTGGSGRVNTRLHITQLGDINTDPRLSYLSNCYRKQYTTDTHKYCMITVYHLIWNTALHFNVDKLHKI